jgi:type IV pilus assembly protein PilV
MIDPPSNLARCVTQRGMTLIEILVAVVVLSIGLLGLAGLQVKGLQVNQGSTFRWQAAMLAEDMADGIRADVLNATAYAGSYTAGGGPSGGTAGTQAIIKGWLPRLATLPKGTATIATTPIAGGNQVTIAVAWEDARARRAVDQAATTAGPAAQNTFTLTANY